MTTPSTPRKAGPLLGTGAQTSWPFTFKVFAASDIAVTIANNLGVETALVLNSDYSVTLNSNQDTSPGGTVTYPISGSALPTGSRLTIFGNLPYDQPLDLPSGGNFSPLALENQLDRLTMQIQQLRENVGRALQLPVTTDGTLSVQLPPPAPNELIGWDSGGNNLANIPLSDIGTAIAFGSYRYDTFTGNGTTTSYALSQDPAVLANLDVSISGVVQVPGIDYSLLTGNLVFMSAPSNGTTILARYGQALTALPDSDQITFVQAGAGATTRTVQNKLREAISVEDFIPPGTNTAATDCTSYLNAAFTAGAGKLVKLAPGATYRCQGQIHMKGDVDGQGATLMFYGTTIPYLVYQNSMGSLRDFTIDGDNVGSCVAGLFVDTDFVFTGYCDYDLVVQNISNSSNTESCSGALFFKASSATNLNSFLSIRVQVSNVVATANGSVGDNGGKASGIIVGFNAAGTNGNVVIHDCNIETVSSGGVDPAEDADGIHLLIAGHNTQRLGLYEIRDCVVKDAKKRGYKIQAANTLVENCVCYGQDTLAGFETYGLNTTFINCKHLQGIATSFTTSIPDTKFIGCYAEGSGATWDLVRVYGGGDYATFDNCTFVSTAAYATGDYGVMRIYEAEGVRLTGTVLSHTGTAAGCSLLIREPVTVNIDGCLFEGSVTGVNLWQSTGRVTISDSEIFASSSCISRQANTVQAVYGRDCRFQSGSNIALNMWDSAGANSAYAEFNNCTVLSTSAGGAWLAPGSRITNCRVENLGTQAGIGVYIPSNTSVVRNCSITNFTTGVLAAFGTNQEIADNVTIGCATTYDLTGSTPLVNTDNFSR